MIQFLKLEITNFLSWGKKQTIPLYKQGVIRVEGVNKDEPSADSNMAGKSTLMEAILWCLYGRTIRNVRHDAVVNRFAKNNCCVSLFFRNDDVYYRVSRYRKHRKHKNRLLLWRGKKGHSLSYRHAEDTQAKLESILGYDYESFTHTTIFGGPRPFALLTDAEQKKVLESFLHFEKFEIALRRAKQLLSKTLEKEHDLELRTTRVRGDIQEIKGRLGSLSRAEEVRRRERARDKGRIQGKLSKLVKPKSGPTREEVEGAGEKVEALVSKLANAKSRGRTIHQRLDSLKKSLRNREKLIGKPCPVCGQEVAASSVKAFLAHVSKDGRTLRGELKQVRSRCSKLERRLSHARAELKHVQEKSEKSSLAKSKWLVTQRELLKRLAELRERKATPFTEEIQSLSVKYSRTVSKLLVCAFQERMLKSRVKDLKFWEEGFGNRGVKALIVREALPAMNQKLAEYAQEIFNGTVKIQFSPAKKTKRGKERELFHLKYRSRYGSSSYVGESSGGRRRVDICVLLVFSWLSRTCNLLLVDELLDGLDSAGRETILNILSELRGTVLVITHERGIKSQLGKVWTVTKRHGMSRLETQYGRA